MAEKTIELKSLPTAGAKFRVTARKTEAEAKAVTEADSGLLCLTSDTHQVYLGGQPYGGMTAEERAQLEKIVQQLFPFTLSVSGGGTYEIGKTVTVTVNWSVKNGDGASVTVNDTAATGNSKTFEGVKADTTYTVKATLGSQVKTGQAKANFVDPQYYGKVAASAAAPTADQIKAASKNVNGGKALTMGTGIALENEKLFFAYPASRGDLAKAVDLALNFDGLSGFTKSTVEVTNLAGEKVSYNVYTMASAVTASARYAFS